MQFEKPSLLMMPLYYIISNFENKNCSIVDKRLSLLKFSVVRFFTKGWVVQKMEPKGNSIKLSMFLKYGLTGEKKAQS